MGVVWGQELPEGSSKSSPNQGYLEQPLLVDGGRDGPRRRDTALGSLPELDDLGRGDDLEAVLPSEPDAGVAPASRHRS